MKLLNISNWFQSLVESFTFYGGAPSSGGGAMGGGRPFNPMQGRMGNMGGMGGMGKPGNMDGMGGSLGGLGAIGKPGLGGMGQPIPGMPPANMGMPPMPQGMPPSQGQPMQGGQFGNMGAYVSPMAQRPQGLPMQGQPTPDMLNNIRMKLQGMGPPPAQPQGQPMQSQPTQGGLFGNMGAYISPVAKR